MTVGDEKVSIKDFFWYFKKKSQNKGMNIVISFQE